MTANPTLTPRQRKLRLTIAALSWLGGLGLLLVTAVYYGRRPNQYDPEEADQAITSSLKLKLPAGAPEPRFTDVTAAAGLTGFQTFRGARTSQLPEDMGGGAAFGDFDNDGDDDLFLVAAGGSLDLPDQELAPSQLYRNRGNGTFELVQDFPEVRLRGMGAAWGDFDGDGFIDLALSGYQVLRLFHNEAGTGRFSAVELTRAQAGFWTGVTWGDFDNDREVVATPSLTQTTLHPFDDFSIPSDKRHWIGLITPGNDPLAAIFAGTDGNDVIRGTSSNDIIRGGRGNHEHVGLLGNRCQTVLTIVSRRKDAVVPLFVLVEVVTDWVGRTSSLVLWNLI